MVEVAAKIKGRGICARCHGLGKVPHKRYFHKPTKVSCDLCGGKGWVTDVFATKEEADGYERRLEKRLKEIADGTFRGLPPDELAGGLGDIGVAVVGAIAAKI
jgi:DnaJ-class molecular chaperone